VLGRNAVLRYDPEHSVTGLAPGAPVQLDIDAVERLVEAFFDDLEAKFAAV
jgi:hypothetical protein